MNWIKNIHDLNIEINSKDAQSQQNLIDKLFIKYAHSQKVKFFLFSFFSLGLYPIFLKAFLRKKLMHFLSERKLKFYKILQQKIEDVRNLIEFSNPKSGIQKIYKSLKLDDDPHLSNLYTKSEVLLFISCPYEDQPENPPSLYKNWQYIKMISRNNEIHYIQKINSCYDILKNRFLLTKEDVNDKLKKTSCCKNSLGSLTLLKNVKDAFCEILASYESFALLKKTHFSIFEVFSIIMNIHIEENKDLLDFFDNKKPIHQLSQTAQTVLLDYFAKTHSIQKDILEKNKNNSALIFNESQEQLFTKLLSSHLFLEEIIHSLLDVHYKNITPSQEIFYSITHSSKKVSSTDSHPFFEKFKKEEVSHITENFFSELYNRGIELDLKSQYFNSTVLASDFTSLNSFYELYQKFSQFSLKDVELLTIIQEITSHKRRDQILEYIQSTLKELLGQNILFNELALSKIRIEKLRDNKLEIGFNISSQYLPYKKEIVQTLKKEKDKWIICP